MKLGESDNRRCAYTVTSAAALASDSPAKISPDASGGHQNRPEEEGNRAEARQLLLPGR